MVRMLFGMVIAVRLLHLLNALDPTFVTPLPRVTEVRPVQPENAHSPTLVTLSGIVTEVRQEHPSNAANPTLSTPSGITRSVTSSPSIYRLCASRSGLASYPIEIPHQSATVPV